MFDREDASFAAALEREIRRRLDGDENDQGLFRLILGSQDWETFVRTKGIIFAYEEVLAEMRNIHRRMNESEPERVVTMPPRNIR